MTHGEYRTYEANVAAFFKREGVENLSTESEDEENFSWRNCECCNRQLGGTRFDAKGYHRTTNQIFQYTICVDCMYYAEYGKLDDMTMLDILCDCGHAPSPSEHTAGYGRDENGNTFCYACCAERDKAQMLEEGKISLYFVGPTMKPGRERYPYPSVNGIRDIGEPKSYKVSNWSGSLTFIVGRVKCGYHNIAGKQYNFWFKGPDGATWHGVNYGDNSQIARCKRIKG